MKYEPKKGDIVRCWDDSDKLYCIRNCTRNGVAFIRGHINACEWDNIEPAHPSEHWAINKESMFPVKTRDMSHIQPEEKTNEV